MIKKIGLERRTCLYISKGKPVMAFLHGCLDELARNKTETASDAWKKLQAFRTKAESKHCKYWHIDAELTKEVLTGYFHMVRTHPATGWVRGDQAKTMEDVEKMAELQRRVSELEAEKLAILAAAQDDTRAFAQGSDEVRLVLESEQNPPDANCPVDITWDQVFAVVASSSLRDTNSRRIREDLGGACADIAVERGQIKNGGPDPAGRYDWCLADADAAKVCHQLLALRLITVDSGGGAPQWSLTPMGVAHLARIQAIRRESVG